MHARTTLLPPKPTEQQRAHTHAHTLSRDKPGPGQSSRTNWRTGKRKSPAPSNPWPPAWQRTRRKLRVGATVLSSAAQCEGAPLPAPRDTAPGCPPGASRCRLAAGSPVCVPTNASTGQCSVVVHTASTAAHLMVSSGSVSLAASPSSAARPLSKNSPRQSKIAAQKHAEVRVRFASPKTHPCLPHRSLRRDLPRQSERGRERQHQSP